MPSGAWGVQRLTRASIYFYSYIRLFSRCLGLKHGNWNAHTKLMTPSLVLQVLSRQYMHVTYAPLCTFSLTNFYSLLTAVAVICILFLKACLAYYIPKVTFWWFSQQFCDSITLCHLIRLHSSSSLMYESKFVRSSFITCSVLHKI